MTQSKNTDEKSLITNLLNMQKQRMITYCMLLSEASDLRIRIMLQDLLIEASEDQYALSQLIESKGWLQWNGAQEDEIQQARHKAVLMRAEF